jgi:hypothetical protein
MHWGQCDKIDDTVYYLTWPDIYFDTTDSYKEFDSWKYV